MDLLLMTKNSDGQILQYCEEVIILETVSENRRKINRFGRVVMVEVKINMPIHLEI